MSEAQSTSDRVPRTRLARGLRIVDRIGLGVFYAVVLAVLPLTAVGIFTRTV